MRHEPRNVGVALSSGGASALAQIGALEVICAAGIRVDCVAGTSAGSIVGAVLASGRLTEFREATSSFTWRNVLGLFNLVWPRGSVLELRSALDFVGSFVPETVDALPVPFAAVAADLATGDEVPISEGRVVDAVRASCAIPGLFPPCRRGDRWLADGALANPLPVSAARALGAGFVIAVNALPADEVQARAFRLACGEDAPGVRGRIAAHFTRRAPALRDGAAEAAAEATDPGDPRLFAVLAAASRIVQCRIAAARLREEPPDFLLNVPVGDVGIFEFHRAADLIELGRRAAEQSLEAIERALARREPALRRVERWLRGASVRRAASSHRSAPDQGPRERAAG